MAALCDVLGDPQHDVPIIHVTGTNGKGSVARLATRLLSETGLTVGTYTSPHLHRINERISRNGEAIADDELAAVLDDLRGLVPLSGVEPSWFELLTAAAYRWFAEVAVDVAVVEVGMLGRFDATNVADGRVAVVTNIGPDHTDFQGDWRRDIATEKAGIIKADATVVLGETDPELRAVFVDAATDVGAEAMWERGEHWDCDENRLAVGGRLLDLRTPNGTVEDVFVPLHGAHQGDNAACALAAVEAFFGHPLGADLVRDALRRRHGARSLRDRSAASRSWCSTAPTTRPGRPSPPRPSPTTSTSPAAGSSSSACWPPTTRHRSSTRSTPSAPTS